MKKITIIFLMLISATAFSQQRDIARNDRAQKIQISSEERAEISSKRMALALDLTEAQRVEIKKLHMEQIKERQTMRAERKKVAQENASKRYTRVNKNLDKRLAQQDRMKEILTEEQYKNWKETKRRPAKKNKAMKKKTI